MEELEDAIEAGERRIDELLRQVALLSAAVDTESATSSRSSAG
jgi:hypothetical protein